jgi:pyruvate dehydrogenase E1 component
LEEITDGDFQRMSTLSPAEFRNELFSGSESLVSMGANLSDEEIINLRRGGHDPLKVYAAYHAALESEKPSVILAHTVKGWGIESFAGRNTTHQKKKMNLEDLVAYRDRLQIPILDENLQKNPFYSLDEDSDAFAYLNLRREKLGGYLPSRKSLPIDFDLPEEKTYSEFDKGTPTGQKVSTTMAFVRLLRNLMKSDIGEKIVPIIPDEGRTFGMDPLFSEFGIYSQSGQKYKPVDHKMIMKYKESRTGQILEEGISEANSIASWLASATSYSHASTPTMPFYIFYSMFGFQRVNDQIWQAADARARGFLMGATAGRTTLNGEGLQHQDGHSLLHASTVPYCRSWDPAYAYELATIIRHGINEMWGKNLDVFHYIMLYNQNEQQPAKPEGIDHKIIKGAYKIIEPKNNGKPLVRLLGSGPILSHVLEASKILADYDVDSEVWSVTSYGELRREGLESQRKNRLYPDMESSSYVSECFGDLTTTIAVSDYIIAVPEMIQRWVGGNYVVLGTDGFGRSDDRTELRRFFEIDTESIVLATISALEREGRVNTGLTEEIADKFKISRERNDKTN